MFSNSLQWSTSVVRGFTRLVELLIDQVINYTLHTYNFIKLYFLPLISLVKSRKFCSDVRIIKKKWFEPPKYDLMNDIYLMSIQTSLFVGIGNPHYCWYYNTTWIFHEFMFAPLNYYLLKMHNTSFFFIIKFYVWVFINLSSQMASTTAINVYSYDRVHRKDFSFYFNKRVFGIFREFSRLQWQLQYYLI